MGNASLAFATGWTNKLTNTWGGVQRMWSGCAANCTTCDATDTDSCMYGYNDDASVSAHTVSARSCSGRNNNREKDNKDNNKDDDNNNKNYNNYSSAAAVVVVVVTL